MSEPTTTTASAAMANASGRSTLELVRASYRDISLYSPDRTPCAIDLSDNTNLWGMPPAAERAIREIAVSAVTRYPQLYAGELKCALAGYAGVQPEEIVTGCGSDDVLDSAIRALAEPAGGQRIAYSDPTFPMIPLFARMNGLEGVAVPLTDTGDIDAHGLLGTEARIIYICSPNNPTGTLAFPRSIQTVLANALGFVILDEAYGEFSTGGSIGLAPSRPNLLVTRTMSKAFGLAGLRVGYAAGAAALVAEVEKSRGPYKVNALAERAALAALGEDLGWVAARIAEVRENRARILEALQSLGLEPLASAANFVLVPVRDSSRIAVNMRESGIAVRPFSNLVGIGDAIRMTIGPWEIMNAALNALARAIR